MNEQLLNLACETKKFFINCVLLEGTKKICYLYIERNCNDQLDE